MKIELVKLVLNNFKTFKSQEIEFSTNHTEISGENGVGKTSVADAICFLWFDKTSTGEGANPLKYRRHEGGKVIPGLVTSVEAIVRVDGVLHSYKKENTERNVKGETKGYTNTYYIDDVVKKEKDYSAEVESMIDPKMFRILTNVKAFNDEKVLPWKERREVLKGMVDADTLKPEDVHGLMDKLKNRTMDEYKSVLDHQKKKYEDERDKIGPRLDEIDRTIGELASKATNKKALETQREKAKAIIEALDKQRAGLDAKSKARQAALEYVNTLRTRLGNREQEIRDSVNDSTELIEQKRALQSALDTQEGLVRDAKRLVDGITNNLDAAKQTRTNKVTLLESLKKEKATLNDQAAPDMCPVCKRPFTEEDVNTKNFETEKASSIARIDKQGVTVFKELKAIKAEVEKLTSDLAKAEADLKDARNTLEQQQADTQAQIQKINDQMTQDRPAPDYTTDAPWIGIMEQIDAKEKEAGEPLTEEIEQLASDRKLAQSDLDEINAALANSDTIRASKARIAELEAREKELGQLIADVECQLKEIRDYVMAECELLTQAVNGKFSAVYFNLFRYRLNGSVEECCEAVYRENDEPYGNISFGEGVFAGIDIINTLSKHFDCRVPLFIDEAAELTKPIETDLQVITLRAVEGRKFTVTQK